MRQLRILYVEDEALLREQVQAFLERRVGKVFVAEDGRMALDIFSQQPVDLVITDLLMPHMDGMTLIREIRKLNPLIPVMITTAINDLSVMQDAINYGVSRFLIKPFQTEQIEEALEAAVSRLSAFEKQKDQRQAADIELNSIRPLEAELAKLFKQTTLKGPDKVVVRIQANLMEIAIRGSRTRMEVTLLESADNNRMVDFMRETYYKLLGEDIKKLVITHLQKHSVLHQVVCDSKRDVDLMKWLID
jgi:YesN/AraC family two-component response regulator